MLAENVSFERCPSQIVSYTSKPLDARSASISGLTSAVRWSVALCVHGEPESRNVSYSKSRIGSAFGFNVRIT